MERLQQTAGKKERELEQLGRQSREQGQSFSTEKEKVKDYEGKLLQLASQGRSYLEIIERNKAEYASIYQEKQDLSSALGKLQEEGVHLKI